MKKTILILFVITFSILSAQNTKTWIATSPLKQLIAEGLDDEMGHGRLFVPVMTKTEWEPEISIYSQNGKVVEKKPMGKSIFLEPGSYRILFGSAEESFDMITKNFDIREQETKIIQPDWGGLLVTVIDETSTRTRMAYEIYHLDEDITIGRKFSRDEEDFEDRRHTWVLQPGKYKLVKAGEPHNTIFNFTTFEIKEGELTQITIVVDSQTQEFKGGGELPQINYSYEKLSKWNNLLYLKGSFSYISDNKTDENDNDYRLTFKGQIDNQVKYDVKPYFLNLKQSIVSGWRKETDEDYRIYQDELSFDNTAIYYFNDIFGLYGELNADFEVFPAKVYYNSSTNVKKINKEGEEETLNDVEEVETSPSIFPVVTSEEAGLNFTILKTARSNFYIRTGIGMIQTFNKDVYEKTGTLGNYDIYEELSDKYIEGTVVSTGADFQFTSSLSYETEARVIVSFDDNEDYDFLWENTFSANLLKYVSIVYDINLSYNKVRDYLTYDNEISIEFSYYFSN